eukprot:755479-Hanusia_phi.AAC.3
MQLRRDCHATEADVYKEWHEGNARQAVQQRYKQYEKARDADLVRACASCTCCDSLTKSLKHLNSNSQQNEPQYCSENLRQTYIAHAGYVCFSSSEHGVERSACSKRRISQRLNSPEKSSNLEPVERPNHTARVLLSLKFGKLNICRRNNLNGNCFDFEHWSCKEDAPVSPGLGILLVGSRGSWMIVADMV